MRLLIETIMKYSTFYYQIKKFILPIFRKIPTNATFFSIHFLKSIDIYNFLVILADNILIKIDAFLWGFLFWIKWYTQKIFWNLNAKLLDFVSGSFPIIKNTSNISSIACILKNQHLQNLENIYGESLTAVFIQIIGERA